MTTALPWTPINSAPDGEEVLVSDGETVATAKLASDGWFRSCGDDPVWEIGDPDCVGFDRLRFSPTHWMPKPDPPVVEKRS